MSPFAFKWLKFSFLALVVGGFVALAVYALIMRDEIRASQIEPPLIAAPTQELKTRPDAPTGLQFPNQDKLVFDLLENTAPTGAGGASATMAAEPSATRLSLAAAASSFASPTQVAAANPAVAPAVSPSAPVAAELPTEAVAAPTPVAAVVQTVAQPAAKPAPEKGLEKPTATAVTGAWGVQLAAVGSAADGQATAKQLQAKLSALSGLTIRVVPAPGGARHRVQFVGLPTRSAAQAVCDKLGSQPCFPVGK
jgi:hypothetical protein